MSTHSSLSGNERLPIYPLRVFRQDEGASHFVRLLSASYGGCFTHWIKGNGQYCGRDECKWNCKKERQIWKGYGAADYWDDKSQLWVPVCFELTEGLELDFRDRWARGQVWHVVRPRKIKGRNPGKLATLLEERDPHTVPHEFDFVPCLLNTYHVFEIDLTVKNPMPPRVLIQAAKGAAPGKYQKVTEPAGLSPEEHAAMRVELRNRINGVGSMPKSSG